MEKPKDNDALTPEEQIADHDYDPKVNLKDTPKVAEATDEELHASWDRLYNAQKAEEKARKARDKADNSLATDDPKRHKAVAKHHAAQKESEAAGEHAAKVTTAHKAAKAAAVKESIMEKTEIVKAILSKDAGRLAEAKLAIKALLDARATQFRAESSKFVAKSLFEGAEQVDEAIDGEHKATLSHLSTLGKKRGSAHDHIYANAHQFSVDSSKIADLHKHLTDSGYKHVHVQDPMPGSATNHHEFTKGKSRVAFNHEGLNGSHLVHAAERKKARNESTEQLEEGTVKMSKGSSHHASITGHKHVTLSNADHQAVKNLPAGGYHDLEFRTHERRAAPAHDIQKYSGRANKDKDGNVQLHAKVPGGAEHIGTIKKEHL
jgi:hypothetical protein